ncbi:cholesterol transport system auxiliary component [Caulobacter ginsengisoli]|uniref:Cholesterol transport system auxiliary component n=1 Tax=Caulobacter ginsengisoli TaxID=400775 RepID=A0ABU0IP41_9CAUL|nr:ABC-type transport auxiliary lipoprotein family protein [Caulobacter ginsengisoli]MDQ0463764.1 cholesterol transport system auxiliary component [Caulobacter ginsengisoli]
MSAQKNLGKALAIAAAALSLTGCVSLFPKADPAQLYRFEVSSPAAASSSATRFTVLRAPITFARAAAGDGILTVTSGEAAYIGGARWVSPASVLFDEAATRAFQDAGGPARLIGRGEIARSDAYLKLDVRTFETRYDQGAKAAPIVVIEVNATLTRNNQALVGTKTFTASARAGDNRVGPIVQAYDKAVSDVLGQLVGWVNTSGVTP